MMYKKLLIGFFILLLMLILAYTQINKESNGSKVEVRGLTLKMLMNLMKIYTKIVESMG